MHGETNQMKNDFFADLAFSELSSDELFWEQIYKSAFQDIACIMLNTAGKSLSQNLGIDRIIHLKSGKTLYIDEKKRRNKYNDIILERYSEYSNGDRVAGWINKDLHIDYLAYAFMDTKEVYLFDWQTLRRVWNTNRTKWDRAYRNIGAKNNGYTTFSIPIPINVLLEAMQNAIIIKLPALPPTKTPLNFA